MSFDVRVRVGFVLGGEQRNDAEVCEKQEEGSNTRFCSSTKRPSVVDPHHMRERRRCPQTNETGCRRFNSFRTNTPYLVELEPLVIACGKDRDWFCSSGDELLADEIGGLLNLSQRDDGLNGKEESRNDILTFAALLGLVRLESMTTDNVINEPTGRYGVMGKLLLVSHLDIGRADKVPAMINHRPPDCNNPFFLCVGVTTFATFPSASFFVDVASEPVANRRSPDAKCTFDLRDISSLF